MLRIHQSATGVRAESYFRDQLSREHYYAGSQEVEAKWHGKLAARLGLEGKAVTEEDFRALVHNRTPAGEKLTPRDRANRTCGYDVTMSPPKSVSILLAHTGDERIVFAHRQAVRDTMSELENDVQVRVRHGGQMHDRTSAEIVWADFTHRTARPIDGFTGVHIHTHAYVINAAWDPVEGRIKAGKFLEPKRNAPYFEAVYNANLARSLNELGYAVERTARDYEVCGISRELISANSRRTEQIEKAAAAKGMSYAEDKAKLGAATRARKEDARSWGEFREHFRGRLNDDERRQLDRAASGEVSSRDDEVTPSRAVDSAIGEKFHGQSVVPERRFLEAALRRGTGSVRVEAVHKEVARRKGEFVRAEIEGRKMITTKGVLQEEQALLKLAREGRGRHVPLGSPGFEFRPLEAGDGSGNTFELNVEQKAAVRHLLTSNDETMLFIGRAGTGKTTALNEARRGIEERGRRVFAVAPSTGATNVLKEEGFQAETVAALLQSEQKQTALHGHVLLVDEAGLVGTKDMRRLLEVAREQRARVILSGDYKQIGSVARGDALRLMESHAGLKPAVVREVQRQKPERYKAAAMELNEGRTTKGYDLLDRELGWVHEVPDDERAGRLADAYVDSVSRKDPRGRFQTALIVTPTHAESAEVIGAVRDRMKAKGRLGQEDRTLRRLVPKHLTDAGKADPSRYDHGDVVRFHGEVRQQVAEAGEVTFLKGQELKVLERGEGGRVIAVDDDGRRHVLPLKQGEKFSVYETREIRVAEGERIRFTLNTYEQGRRTATNGQFAEVAGFTKTGDLKLEDGRVLSHDHGHFASGIATTIDAAQGQTTDHVFLSASSDSLSVLTKERFGVAVSRGRHQAHIFTDDKRELREAVAKSGQRTAAVDLAEQAKWDQQRFAKVRQWASRAREYAHERLRHAKSAWERYRAPDRDAVGPVRDRNLSWQR